MIKCQCGSRDVELQDIIPDRIYPDNVVIIYKCKECGLIIRISRGRYEERCPTHPRYTVKKPPKSNCPDCWHIWYRKHGDIL